MNGTVKPDHGEGTVLKFRTKGKDGTVKESKYWYVCYYVGGKQIKKNSKCVKYIDAYNMLHRLRGQIEVGEQPAQSQRVFRYEDMRDLLLANYAAKKRAVHLNKDGSMNFNGSTAMNQFFAGMAIVDITTTRIQKYVDLMRDEGLKDPSIRRHLNTLGKMFTLAKHAKKIHSVPYIEKPADSEPAGIVITPEDFEKILANMPEVYRPFFIFQNQTACRVGATLQVDWTMVNLACDEIALPAAITKTRKPLTLPLVGHELEKLSSLLNKSDRTGPVFHSDDYLKVWKKAFINAGVAHLEKREGRKPLYVGARVHDNRVAGARALVQSGVDIDTAMKVGGWKTPHVFSRYNIVDVRDVAAALRKRAMHGKAA